MKRQLQLLSLFAIIFTSTSFASPPADGRIDIWPTIPFIRGADLCRYKDAYSQTRSEYMSKMTSLASGLMWAGAGGRQAFSTLYKFNQLYDQNLAVATQQQYLDITLESTLKAYLSGYYRDLRPRTQKISFTDDLLSMIRAAADGQRDASLSPSLLAKLDYIAYGSYALAPDCNGTIQVTLHLISRTGDMRSYLGKGQPSLVMSQIASKLFEDFQRTQFPSTIKVGGKNLTLIGGMNGSVDVAASPLIAKQSCETLNARLPDEFELEMLNAYGDWSGGVSLGSRYWALPSGKVFAPMLRNPSPVREVWEVNSNEFSYYCVEN